MTALSSPGPLCNEPNISHFQSSNKKWMNLSAAHLHLFTSSLGVKMFNCSIYSPVEQQNTAKHGTPGQEKNINSENAGANLVG